MDFRILEGSVLDTLPTIPKGSIDCVVTSPPYWALRSYLPKGHALKHLELGSEKTPDAFVANLVRIFSLVRDVMADHGTVWLNIGDTYSGGGGYSPDAPSNRGGNDLNGGRSKEFSSKARSGAPGIPAGNLCLIPWRLALALQADGWIVRSVIVWHKPAPMPQSVSGWQWRRCRVLVEPQKQSTDLKKGQLGCPQQGSFNERYRDGTGHAKWQDCPGCKKCEATGGYVLRRGSWRPTSSWEPILMLAKSQRYFADGEPVKTTVVREWDADNGPVGRNGMFGESEGQSGIGYGDSAAGANARDVQSWAAEPLREKHYAAFPTALVTWCLRAGTSAKGYCPACGAPWVRMVDAPFRGAQNSHPKDNEVQPNRLDFSGRELKEQEPLTTLGWRPSCQCPEHEPRPGMVLDPFCGSGRTGVACQRLGLDFVGCELNPEYVEMATRLLKGESPLFARDTG